MQKNAITASILSTLSVAKNQFNSIEDYIGFIKSKKVHNPIGDFLRLPQKKLNTKVMFFNGEMFIDLLSLDEIKMKSVNKVISNHSLIPVSFNKINENPIHEAVNLKAKINAIVTTNNLADKISFDMDLRNSRVLIIGPGPSDVEISQFLIAFPFIKEISVLDIDANNFITIDKCLEIRNRGQKEKNTKVYGYVQNIVEPSEGVFKELEERFDIVFDDFVFDPNQLAFWRLEDALHNVSRTLKNGGIHMSFGLDTWEKLYKTNIMHKLISPEFLHAHIKLEDK